VINLNRKWDLIVILCLLGVVAFQSFWIVSLSTQNINLRNEKISLEAQLSQLQTLYNVLEANYSSLQQDYAYLNEEYSDYQSAYDHLLSTLNLRWHHPDENEKLLITPCDPAVTQIVFQITGGWSNPADWNEYWDDVEAMYNWVVDNIEYRYDGLFPILPANPSGSVDYVDEMWQFPNETLTLRKGDCDDMAILLASMILSYTDCEYTVECVVTEHHAALYFPVASGKVCILDPAGRYTTNTGWPNYDLCGKDIQQEVYNWLNHIGESQVEWVFSHKLWKQFDSTEEFINWLYNR